MSTNNLNKSKAYALPARPLRNSAKALIIREQKILCTRNRDLLGEFFLLPGGGQNHGEPLIETVARECLEETGARIKVNELLFVREYISANHELAEFDDSIHQIEFMFACELIDEPDTIKASCIDEMQTGVEWLEISELHTLRFYPGSLTRELQNMQDTVKRKIYLGDTL